MKCIRCGEQINEWWLLEKMLEYFEKNEIKNKERFKVEECTTCIQNNKDESINEWFGRIN